MDDSDEDDEDADDEDDDVFDDDGRVYKNPRNSPSPLCPRDEEQATLLVSVQTSFARKLRAVIGRRNMRILLAIFEKLCHSKKIYTYSLISVGYCSACFWRG